ncbi:hypothetical protein [Caminibacter sp.]
MDIIEDLLPSSPFFYLVYLVGITLFGLLLIYLISKLNKPASNENKPDKKLTINDLIKIAKNPNSTQKDLLFALMAFNENFSVESNKNRSFELFKLVLNHKNRNKALFDYFHGNILPKNLKFKNELDKLEKEALKE